MLLLTNHNRPNTIFKNAPHLKKKNKKKNRGKRTQRDRRLIYEIAFIFLKKILFIYLTEIETASERGNTSRGSGRGRSRLIAEEPDVGLDPTTPGSRPEPKADA